MSPTNQRNDLEIERQLADFADQVMEGKMNPVASTQDQELLGLEETILRLDRAFPKKNIEDAASKQMLVRLKARMRREEEQAAEKPSFWKNLFNFQSNPQVGMILAAVAVLILAVVTAPMLTNETSVTGTASAPTGFIAGGVVILLLLALFIFRRK